jgi:transcriptional regulator of acetoin/glycerol metabolism
MNLNFSNPNKVKVSQEILLLRHTVEFEVDRPIQAWQWMNQTRTVPEHGDWVRPEVRDAWQRCLEEYHLPLGNYANWDDYPVIASAVESTNPALNIEKIIDHLNENFHTFLKEASVMLVLTAADGRLLSVMGEQKLPSAFLNQMYTAGANWSESVLGNNGIGTTAFLEKPIAFQGMEHFLNVLHPFTTVGYPLHDANGKLIAVVGLVSDYRERMNSLFAFLHLICVLVNTNLPLAKSTVAQERVLEKIQFTSAKKVAPLINDSAMSKELDALLQKAVKLQTYKIPILVTGESGVGKDHFVRLLKNAGPRKDAPLIAINCASIPRDLIESELFGYEAGSFTGAKSGGKAGKFLQADKGILFLDEIGDLSLDMQVKLLRVLESGELERLGDIKTRKVNVRLVAATNVNLQQAVKDGKFRADLYYRLNAYPVNIPPLRDRKADIPLLVEAFIKKYALLHNKRVVGVTDKAMRMLMSYDWPGNIRELENAVHRALLVCPTDRLRPEDFKLTPVKSVSMGSVSTQSLESAILNLCERNPEHLFDLIEETVVRTVFDFCENNQVQTAKLLGISRNVLRHRLSRCGLLSGSGGSILST